MQQTRFVNLFLVPSRPTLAGAAVELAQAEQGETYLGRALEGAEERFSFVFVDCPPSLGPLTVNALAAASRVLVPVQCEYLALEGLAQLLPSMECVRGRLNHSDLGGMLLTMVDSRTTRGGGRGRSASALRRSRVRAVVPRSVRLTEAPSHGLPITAYDRASVGADAYFRVAGELVGRR